MEQIILIVKELLTHLGIKNVVIHEEEVVGQKVLRIETEESRQLIGVHGDTIRMIEFVVKRIAEKKGLTDTHFTLDVDGYRAQRIKEIEQKAIVMAERARAFQYDVELPPMSAYERLIVHAALTNAPQVKTESQGEGRERKVVIRYIPE